MNYWDTLDPKYRLILCDIWGVVHNGVELYPARRSASANGASEGRCVILLTNAPRTAEAVEQQLSRLGLPRDACDFVATSGEAGIEALNALGKPVGFIGTAGDREVLEGRDVRIAERRRFHRSRLHRDPRGRARSAQDYRAELERLVDRDVQHALPQSRPAGHSRRRSGSLRRRHRRHLPDARRARDLVRQAVPGDLPTMRSAAPAIRRRTRSSPSATGSQTDILGAARMGFDTVFVSGGINARRAVSRTISPSGTASATGGRWRLSTASPR